VTMRQEIMIACAELYEAILSEYLGKFNDENEIPSVKDKQTINSTCTSIINHFTSILDLQNTQKLESVDDLETIITIYFSVAQTYMKYYQDNPRILLNNVQKKS